jgi:Spy/CpxP family protein refolding chaperone
MRQLTRSIRRSALLLALLPAFALAQHGPMRDGGPMPFGHPGCGMADGAGMPHPGMHHGGVLRRLQLDEAQQDKLFALRHDQEPQQRALHKQARKARRALAELAHSGNYSDAQGKPLADSLAQAEAGLALMHARFQSQVLALLTPQQRERMKQTGCGMGRPGMERGRRGAHGPQAEAAPQSEVR